MKKERNKTKQDTKRLRRRMHEKGKNTNRKWSNCVFSPAPFFSDSFFHIFSILIHLTILYCYNYLIHFHSIHILSFSFCFNSICSISFQSKSIFPLFLLLLLYVFILSSFLRSLSISSKLISVLVLSISPFLFFVQSISRLFV